MRQIVLPLTLLIPLFASGIANAQPVAPAAPRPAATTAPSLEARGRIDSVTVYRGQALVTRTVDVPAPGGLREIVVTDLPVRVVGGSLYAESADGAEVRSVLYRERPVDQDVRGEVRKLDDQIRDQQDLIAANQRNAALNAEKKAHMDRLDQFVAPTAQVELSKGVLNAEMLKSLTVFQFEQRQTIAADELKLSREGRELQAQLSLLQRQRNEVSNATARSAREAVIFGNFPAGGGRLRVRYLVADATWSPSYNIRGEAGAKQVTLEYNASINQMSGEDWSDVQMTLSTATPSLVATAPLLDPLAVMLAAPKPEAAAAGAGEKLSYSKGKDELRSRRDELEQQRQAAGNNFFGNASNGQSGGGGGGSINGILSLSDLDAARKFDKSLNDVADQMQVLEIVNREARDRDSKLGIGGRPSTGDETVSVTYQLAGRTSLPSRQDTQLIQIAATQVKAEFYKLAIPVLTAYVYDQATITNDGKMVLLAGPVASYLNGQFVGGGQLPTVAIGETFVAGFGVDSSLRAYRELLDKTDVTQGGNRVVNFDYKLTVQNFGAAPATGVRVMDRLPTAKENEVKVTIAPTSKEISADPRYQATERKKGLLRWDIDVPAQAIGEKGVTIGYQYKLEYDRQMTIVGTPAGR